MVIVTPLFGGIAIALTGTSRPYLRAATTLVGAVLHATLLLLLAWRVYTVGPVEYFPGGWISPMGIQLQVDAFSGFFLGLLALGHLAAVLYRIGSDQLTGWDDKSATLTSLYFAALTGITVTADLFNLFVFVELATVTTLGLISRKRREDSTVAGFTYLILASLSGVLFLLSVLVLYITTGSVTANVVAERIASVPASLHAVVVGAILVAFGIKFGLVPLHLWQPRAYVGAGSSTAAVFSAFGMKIYLYALIRLLWFPLRVPELSPQLFDLLLFLGTVNILVGHLAAISETNLIRMLAFSSVAHVGYILLGVAIAGRYPLTAGTTAMVAALFHMAMHALAKSALLWSGRRFIADRRSSSFVALTGSGTDAVGAMIAFSLAALVIIGIPPTGGFASKWYVALEQISVIPVVVIAAGTVLSLIYYARFFLLLNDTSAGVPRGGPARHRGLRLDTLVVLLFGAVALASGSLECSIRTVLYGSATALIRGGVLP
jgi:multicomponent Na+:H+ antiporter subunit D